MVSRFVASLGMAYERCSVIGGPCKVVTCYGTYATEGDVTVDVKREFRDLTSSLSGNVGKLLTKTQVEIKFTPVSKPGYVSSLYRLQPTNIGQSIYGCTDCWMRIAGRDGIVREFRAVGVKKPPQLNLSARKNLFGEVVFGAVVANNTDISTAGSVTSLYAQAFTELADSADINLWVSRCGRASWGTVAPFNEIHTDEGVTFDVEYSTKTRETDCNGIVDEFLTDIKVTCKLTPANLTQQDFNTLLPMDGPQAVPGFNENTRARELKVEHFPNAGGIRARLFAATPESGPQRWGREVSRFGEFTFNGLQSVAGNGMANPLYLFEVM